MPASLLASDSAALRTRDDLLARMPWPADAPGLAQARLLADYVIGRRTGELDVSGRSSEGTFTAPSAAPDEVILVDDPLGLQTRVLSELTAVRTYNDRLDEARNVAAEAPGAEPVADLADVQRTESGDVPGETWAVVDAPKATHALAEAITVLHPLVTTLIVIGRSDVMSRAVNKELARAFGRVDVSPGVGKNRLIIGSRPLTSPSLTRFPRTGVIDTPATGPLTVSAHGACFSGTKADEGSSLLLTALAEASASPDAVPALARPASVLDLGAGNGWLLTAAIAVTGADTGVGVDVSKAAVASARETAEANGTAVDIILAEASGADAGDTDSGGTDDPLGGAYDLILLNPPFHHGTAIETDTAAGMMRTAAAHLTPGGRVLTVFNSHLRYRDRLEDLIGPSVQLARTAKFTVVESRLPGE
ncbi:methyltransferase [Brevibacterium casei]|uniref:16S RNA G1207 methylase RsmC n=1 Tax=Brevibacterium casei S18 TaxID=1229781 RepID=K9AG61_9MICO|nr:methyltransferase [Brevibacterium casei]EKU46284.1 16S RNA G1207 methylase RsmC [Brevibacterium casei S18]QQT70762.1 methyltransferase [Brevibacterium casei]